jgi:hypothetical protein
VLPRSLSSPCPQPCHAGKGGLEELAVNRVEDEANMIEPRCLIKEHGRPCLLRDDFAVRENGFIGPVRGGRTGADL